MELATIRGSSSSGGLSLAAISAVFTIGYVANLLGEDECSPRMAASGSMASEDGVPAFTRHGIEYLQQIIADKPAAGRATPQVEPTE